MSEVPLYSQPSCRRQDSVDQMAIDIKKQASSETGHDSADEFVAFMKRVQRGDARVLLPLVFYSQA